MRIATMCPKCGSVIGRENDNCEHESDTCQYCHIKRIDIDFDAEILRNTPINEFHIIEEKINRKFLFQLPTFDEVAYEARLKKEREAKESLDKMLAEHEYQRNHPKCPKCHSTAITAGQRGFSIVTGFIGSSSTVNRCASCGFKWKP